MIVYAVFAGLGYNITLLLIASWQVLQCKLLMDSLDSLLCFFEFLFSVASKKNLLFFRNFYIQTPEIGSFYCFSTNFPRGRFLISKDTTKSKMPSAKLKEICKFCEARCFYTFQKMLKQSY